PVTEAGGGDSVGSRVGDPLAGGELAMSSTVGQLVECRDEIANRPSGGEKVFREEPQMLV
ncbi:hypothetical protein DN524_31790, partial [Burkholderia multivorans]|uniref:hypothetical protein n=1 Tax=Burkholderia multivorans TaxID=87883 RepID=UPI000DB64CD3